MDASHWLYVDAEASVVNDLAATGLCASYSYISR